MQHRHVLLSLVLCLIILIPGYVLAAPAQINKITVNITATEQPPARIAKRMTTSVTTVGEQMLIGRSIDEVAAQRDGYERLVREIFNRVLVGYSVEEVAITPSTTTHIAVQVAPWGDIVRDVSLEVETSGLSPELATLIKNDLGKIEDQVGNVLIGLPVDSVEWAGNVSKGVIREMLEDQLPEFRSNLEINAGQHTTVKLSLTPTGPVIQDVNVALRSRTIPNILLSEANPATQEAAKLLRGLPVAFVERHKDFFTSKVSSAAASHPLAKQYGLTLVPAITTGTETDITLNVETNKYRVSLDGNLDVGRSDDTTSAKLHVGKFFSDKDELYMEVNFIPSSVSWDFSPGWSRKLGETTFAGVRYSLSDKESTVWINQYAGSNWTFRLERTPSTNYNEFGVRYKLHDFLSAEYIFTEKENWLRLVANL